MSLAVVEQAIAGSGRNDVWYLSGHKSEVLAVASDSSNVLATCDKQGLGLLWKLNTSDQDTPPAHVGRLATDGPAIVDACFLQHVRLCTAQGDGNVGIHDLETGKRELSLSRAPGRMKCVNWPVINAVSTWNDKQIVFGGDDGFLVLCEITQKEPLASLNLRVPITSIAASGDSFFVADVTGMIRCFDGRTLNCVYSSRGHSDVVSCVSLNEDASILVSYGMDNLVGLWDVMPFAVSAEDRLIHRFNVQHSDTRDLLRCSWLRDGSVLVPTGHGEVVRLHTSMHSGKISKLFVQHNYQPVRCAASVCEGFCVSAAGSEVVLQRVL
ncbi:hypothetical protein ERJ75_001247700 [Trypanosoma vivax]|uniref:Uncharacterized protein n=1 Tax=Trypanosoma vivax (strain Y486) TaxID=1055687 RepID=G0UD19_TRYVY|nr:hypothetical protein TRVL_04093 [Trypanosoma vivax]KAH8609196.1 hypothetical protein ERJ75_001247700 [Trypanosoma vivax]CCC53729.1 conserved hypothetical protein [Trypanosoma vivax Y486]